MDSDAGPMVGIAHNEHTKKGGTMSSLISALDAMENAQKEVETISYNELRNSYNDRRKRGAMKYTFKSFLSQTGLDQKVMKDPKTGSRCFIADDITKAMRNYQSSLKEWKSQAKGRKPLTPKQKKKAEATIAYGRYARTVIEQCSNELKKKYGINKKVKNHKLSDLHNEMMSEYSKMDAGGAKELDALYKAYKTA